MQNDVNDIRMLMASKNWITYHKPLAKAIGIFEAVIFGELVSKSIYFEDNNLSSNGWFFSTVQSLEEELGIKRKQQEKAIKTLIGYGLIEQEIKGLPAKRYFKVNTNVELFNNIISGNFQLGQKERHSKDEKDELERTNDTNPIYKNKDIILKDKNKEYIGCCSTASNQQTFDPRITDKQIKMLTAHDADLQLDMLKVFRYFFLQYDALYGMDIHPKIKLKTLERIVVGFGVAYIGCDDTEKVDVSVQDYKSMIDIYIRRKFKQQVDHSIVHFFEQSIINKLIHEVWNT